MSHKHNNQELGTVILTWHAKNTRYVNSTRGTSSSVSRRDQEEGGGLDTHEEVSPEEIKSREVELGLRVGLLFFLQLFPNGECTDIVTLFCIAVGTAIAWCVVAAQCRTDTALTFCCSGGGPRQPWSSKSVSYTHLTLPTRSTV